PHPNPTSFPTRRSSDLKKPRAIPPKRGAFTDQYSTTSTTKAGRSTSSHAGSGNTVSTRPKITERSMRPRLKAFTGSPWAAESPRSEEHTSELQSRFDLV